MAAFAARLRSAIPLPTIAPASAKVSPIAFLLVLLALGGLGLTVTGTSPDVSDRPIQAPLLESEAAPLPRGELPIIGDPIRDLTIWYAQRVSDANRAAVENLRGNFLTPTDPLSDQATTDLYGKMLVITIPLLTLGGLILGYLIMVARTTGESAYAVRAVTPRFVVGTVLSICGIFLVSVLAQFVIVTDLAMVGVALRPESVGTAEEWPAGGGVFMVLQRAGFDPRIGEGPANWNSGAWLSSGLLAGVLMTFVQMLNAVLGAVERLLVLLGPICLAAYALPATQRLANLWLKLLAAVLAVRFGWALVFILFSLQVPAHVDGASVPMTVDDTNALIGLALGAAALMLVLPPVLVSLVLNSPGPMRVDQ
jgi:hypothetical protein